MTSRQLNIRLDHGTVETLEGAAYIRGEKLPDLLRSIIDNYVVDLQADSHVQGAMRLRAERALKESKLRLVEPA